MSTERCRSCTQSIFWRHHLRTGKAAPIDADPAPDGNVILVGAHQYDVIGRGDPTPPPDIERFTSHWQTCPDAATWREKMKERKR